MARHNKAVTTIGMASVKAMRQTKALTSHPGLLVWECVPFYFCPRSEMLYIIHKANHPGVAYRGGQGPIVHLEADPRQAVNWANAQSRRWAFTTSNAASAYAEEYLDLGQLNQIDWDAVQARQWSGSQIPRSVAEGKQAEFLVEQSLPLAFGVPYRPVLPSDIRD